jgi:radical SAM superfamily enzyme YgiQ (UPF0313 family)
MRHTLLISFDLIRDGEPQTSLSIASLSAYLQQDPRFGDELVCDHLSFNLLENPALSPDEAVASIRARFDLGDIESIAISCYVWSEYLVNPLIKALRSEGFTGRIILGGYQISYADALERDYPDCQVFIKGYAEESLRQAIFLENQDRVVVLDTEPDFSALPSAYLSGVLPIEYGQSRVRLETKRGCPYRCSFCAHRDLQRNRVYRHAPEKVLDEIAFLASRNVGKINVLDPVFNMGSEYLGVLEYMTEIELQSLVSLQTRFENIHGPNGEMFLELCQRLDVNLEFGLQTVNLDEMLPINRRNKKQHIEDLMARLNELAISYEVSIIYGLPNQTFDSFRSNVDFLKSNGCAVIKAYPLMLLKGTELFANRDRWDFREEVIGEFHIPVVVSSSSFDQHEWHRMRELAESLEPSGRY